MIEVNLYGEVYEWNAEDLVYTLNRHQDEDVIINIDSEGGDVFSGLRICNAIENHKGKVTAKCGVLVASIASVIASVCDEILVNKNTFFMVHKAWGVAIGNSEDMDSVGHLLSLADDRIKEIISNRATDASKIEEWFTKDTWFGCQEVIDNFRNVIMDSNPKDYKDVVFNSVNKVTYAKLENKPEALMDLMNELDSKEEEEKQENPQDVVEEKPASEEEPKDEAEEEEAPKDEEQEDDNSKEEEEKKAQARLYVEKVLAKAETILNA